MLLKQQSQKMQVQNPEKAQQFKLTKVKQWFSQAKNDFEHMDPKEVTKTELHNLSEVKSCLNKKLETKQAHWQENKLTKPQWDDIRLSIDENGFEQIAPI